MPRNGGQALIASDKWLATMQMYRATGTGPGIVNPLHQRLVLGRGDNTLSLGKRQT